MYDSSTVNIAYNRKSRTKSEKPANKANEPEKTSNSQDLVTKSTNVENELKEAIKEQG